MKLEEQNRTYHEAQDSMSFLPNYFRWTYGELRPYIAGNVVELGCGAGFGIKFYIDRANHIWAVDYNDRLLSKINSEYQDESKITTIKADLTADWDLLSHVEPDTVILMDVLEHFDDDTQFMVNAASLLRDQGRLLVKVPSGQALYSNADIASGHYRRYDEADLIDLARKADLQLVSSRQINWIGALAYKAKHKNSKNFSKTFSKLQLIAINHGIRLVQYLDKLPLNFGLSHIAIFRKRK